MSSPLTSPIEDEESFQYPQEGDYSSRMDDILSDSEGEEGAGSDGSEEGFFYNGQDASTGGYREQLSLVLGEEVDDLETEHALETHLLRDLSGSPIPSASPPQVAVSLFLLP